MQDMGRYTEQVGADDADMQSAIVVDQLLNELEPPSPSAFDILSPYRVIKTDREEGDDLNEVQEAEADDSDLLIYGTSDCRPSHDIPSDDESVQSVADNHNQPHDSSQVHSSFMHAKKSMKQAK